MEINSAIIASFLAGSIGAILGGVVNLIINHINKKKEFAILSAKNQREDTNEIRTLISEIRALLYASKISVISHYYQLWTYFSMINSISIDTHELMAKNVRIENESLAKDEKIRLSRIIKDREINIEYLREERNQSFSAAISAINDFNSKIDSSIKNLSKLGLITGIDIYSIERLIISYRESEVDIIKDTNFMKRINNLEDLEDASQKKYEGFRSQLNITLDEHIRGILTRLGETNFLSVNT